MLTFTNQNRLFSCLLCSLVAALLCFAQIEGNTLLILLCLIGFMTITAYFTIKNFSLPVLLFFLPWCKILRVSPTSYSFFTLALVMVCVLKLLMSKLALKKYQIATGIILVFLTLLSKVLHGNDIAFSYIMFMAMILLFPLIKEERFAKGYDFYTVVVFLSVGVVMASLCAQYFAEYSNIMEYIRVDNYNTITRRCGFYGDPNFYNAQVSAAMAGCLVLIFKIKDKRKTVLLCILTMILIYCGLLSGSKSFILVFAGMVLLWLYQLLRMRGNGGQKAILIVVSVAFALYVSSSVLFDELIEVTATRLSRSDTISDFTTGRTELWDMYVDAILADVRIILLGVGYTNVMVHGYASHSTLLQSLYQLGIAGTIPLVVWCIRFTLSDAKRIPRSQRIYIMILVIGIFVPWMAIDMLFFDEFFLFQIYMFISLTDDVLLDAQKTDKETSRRAIRRQNVFH